jgi:DNA-binding response OmpR family regulator
MLLVEDDALLASGLVVALRRAHYTVEHVGSGVAALAALADNAFDIAVGCRTSMAPGCWNGFEQRAMACRS